MKNNDKDFDFRAWRDIEPPGDFTQNVMRRIRVSHAQEPRWHEAFASFLASRLAFGATLAASLVVAVVALRAGGPGPSHDTLSLEPHSLIVAYEKFAGGQ